MKNGKNISLRTLIQSDKALLLISVVFAVIVWFAVTMYASPSTDSMITVPITIDMSTGVISQNNYQVFGSYTQSVDVGVKGPSYLVKSLTPDDIEAIAKTNNVDGAGEFNLKVSVNLKNGKDEISITSQSIDSVNVLFDVNEVKEYEIEVDDSLIKDSISDDCILNSMTPLTSKIEISGPKSQTDTIKRVVCVPKSDEILSKTATLDCNLKLEGYESGDTVTVSDLVVYEKSVKVKIDIWKNAKIPARVVLLNNTNAYTASISPMYIDVFIDTEFEDKTEYIDIASIDCTDIVPGDYKTFYGDEIELDSSVRLKNEDISYTVTFRSAG